MEVHKELGCGFLEALYQEAFEHELGLRKIHLVRQKPHRVALEWKRLVLSKEFAKKIENPRNQRFQKKYL